jgi:hemerythrin
MYTYDECRCFVDHLIAEHRRLHRMLRVARNAIMPLGAATGSVPSADMVKLLSEVRQELEHHFAEEEGGGCLEEAVSRCPSLSDEARRIEAEHPRLLQSIDGLIAQAQDSDQSVPGRIEVARQFDELCAQLEAHEGAENALLRKAFGVNVNGAADGPNPESKLHYDV